MVVSFQIRSSGLSASWLSATTPPRQSACLFFRLAGAEFFASTLQQLSPFSEGGGVLCIPASSRPRVLDSVNGLASPSLSVGTRRRVARISGRIVLIVGSVRALAPTPAAHRRLLHGVTLQAKLKPQSAVDSQKETHSKHEMFHAYEG